MYYFCFIITKKILERWQSWPIASDLKSEDLVRGPWVRILLSPQKSIVLYATETKDRSERAVPIDLKQKYLIEIWDIFF